MSVTVGMRRIKLAKTDVINGEHCLVLQDAAGVRASIPFRTYFAAERAFAGINDALSIDRDQAQE